MTNKRLIYAAASVALPVGKLFIFFLMWAIGTAMLVPIDLPNPAVWRFWAELLAFCWTALLSAGAFFVDKGQLPAGKPRSHLRANCSITAGLGFFWIGGTFAVLLCTRAITIAEQQRIPQLALWMLAVVLNAAMQELLVRGYLYNMLKTHYSHAAAAVLTTVLFTAMHGGAFEQGMIAVCNVATMSLLMSALLERTQQLIWPICLHAAWNLLGGLVLGAIPLAEDYPSVLMVRFHTENPLSGNGSVEASPLVLIIHLALLAALLYPKYRPLHTGQK